MRLLGERGWVWNGEVGALEIGCCEGRDVVPDGGRQFGDGFLDLDGIVVGLEFVYFGNPIVMSVALDKETLLKLEEKKIRT